MQRALRVAAGLTLALAGLVLALAAAFAPSVALNPLDAPPQSPLVNLATGMVTFFVGSFLVAAGLDRD